MRGAFSFCWRGLLLLLFLIGSGRTEPWEFDLESAAWQASDIVIGRQNGQSVTVSEIWEGQLAKGTVIERLDLPAMPIEVPSQWIADEVVGPKTVSGRRIAVFLRDPQTHVAQQDGKPIGAGGQRLMGVRAAWIEEGRVYAIRQIKDPGPLKVRPLGNGGKPWINEAEFKQAVEKVLADKRAFEKARAIADPAQRAAALRPMADGPFWCRRDHVLSALVGCRSAGVPALKELLAEHPQLDSHKLALLCGAGRRRCRASDDRSAAERTAVLENRRTKADRGLVPHGPGEREREVPRTRRQEPLLHPRKDSGLDRAVGLLRCTADGHRAAQFLQTRWRRRPMAIRLAIRIWCAFATKCWR